ncbi:hypothetical protein [Staphylococcus warneri]|uniref:Uncharacterized protein n=1 Tax=uncultured Caudovirales phage TaxID=2100421 RepID=A0A2H4J862_9CAUD|nr:hypothetical protein [Staphylococcus warneri]ASN69507.1 hypothetical protein 10S13_43 [uncultured Caudovirales phage]EEQ78938.1 hypothetical protein STAWA0001_0662 [Staphylococcus warneri L37603]MCI2788440.1 hypothetical protein [Staphylococcus warneri]MCJ1804186.1 hypothetical protein [Staphylococcus warneri]MDK4214568.1 hypothetical protein [Staphylococcus warneri]
MIDQFDNESLKEPQNMRILFTDLSNNVKKLRNECDALENSLNDPDVGIRMSLKEIRRDIETLDKKINIMTEQQSDTRKTVKNASIGGVLTASIGGIVAFVLKQIGLY